MQLREQNMSRTHKGPYSICAFLAMLFLSYLLAAQCRPLPGSYFGLATWEAYTEQKELVRFRELKNHSLILNLYSPTCPPCIAELPALELFYKECQKRNTALFLGVEGDLERNGLKEAGEEGKTFSPKQEWELIWQRLKKDQKTYHISIPMLVFPKGFRVGPEQVVQAKPETLFFMTKPLRLKYNFVGPLSYEREPEKIRQDHRFQFALRKLREL